MTSSEHFNADCGCCGRKMWVTADTTPLCASCEETVEPLLVEIRDLKAQLASFQPCDPRSTCVDYEGFVHARPLTEGRALQTYRSRKVYHRAGE